MIFPNFLKNKDSLFFSLILLVFFSLSFLNYYGSVDKVSVQWLYLSCISIFSICFFLYKGYTLSFSQFNISLKLFIVFLIYCITILPFSNNIVESLIVFSRWLIIFSVFYIFSTSIKYFKPSFKVISLLISLILFFEISYSLSPLIDILMVTDFSNDFSVYLKGVTGNKNITSAIIAMKLPFVYFLLYRSNNFFIKLFSFIVLSLSIFLLLFLSTRAILLSIFLLFLFYILYFSITNFKYNIRTLFYLIGPLFFSFLLYQISTSGSSSLSVQNRITSVMSFQESSVNARLRYYNNAFDQILTTPLFGTGLGFWKVKSVKYDKDNIIGYTVPYNAHNDLLEIGAEVGLIGLTIYLLFIVSVLHSLIKQFISNSHNRLPVVVLLSVLFVYFVDLNLNFPTYRPVSHIVLLLCAALSSNFKYISNE